MSRTALHDLVQSGAGEPEIQALMKRNLYLLGESCTMSSNAGKNLAFSNTQSSMEKPIS
jgi:hypothetical protein